VSTAQRVYAELIRRGMASGEVGRGTFVRLAVPAGRMTPSLAEPTSPRIDLDLDLDFPTVPQQQALLASSLAKLMRRDEPWRLAFAPASARGTRALRSTTATFLSAAPGRWSVPADRLLFAGNGKQAIAAVLSATVPRGERLGVEALTYPFIKTVAQQLGIRLVPLPLDDEGIVPAALMQAHGQASLSAIYLQPTLHNPLGVSMSAARSAEIAEILRTQNILAIEDTAYAFLDPNGPSLQWLVPDDVVRIDSLSKRLAPGLTLGFIIVPPRWLEDISRTLHGGAWVAPAFAQTVCARWMADGTAAKITDAKRIDAAARQRLAHERLGRFGVTGNAQAYHCWLPLPPSWRADMFVAAAGRNNIAVTPASTFAVVPGDAPSAVRLALSAPPLDLLEETLEKLASILDGGCDAPPTLSDRAACDQFSSAGSRPRISSLTSSISRARDGRTAAPSHRSGRGQRLLRGQMMRAGCCRASSIQAMLSTLATAVSASPAALGMRPSPRR
jgi:DNA-binding transcriptional MocR family regulator